jgi:hypothetical protein
MELLDYIRMTCRVSSGVYDEELMSLIEAARADMIRVGVDPSYVEGDDALVRQAISCYCKSRFGFDNEDAALYWRSYSQMVADMMNGPHNVACIEQRGSADD